MGYGLNRVTNLGIPFQAVQEQVVVVPSGNGHIISNQVRKLLFVLSGECQHEVIGWNGPWGTVHLHPGDILAVPYGCKQRYYGLETSRASHLHVVRLSFDPDVLPPLPFGGGVPLPLPGPEGDIPIWAEFCLQEMRFLRATSDSVTAETVSHLRSEMENRTPGYHLRVRALCVSLTILFARAGLERPKEERIQGEHPRSAGHHVARIKTYLRSRLHQPTRLTEVAAVMGLSDEHTARLFKAATGLTISEYGRRLRIAEAKSLLAATDNNLSEIACQTGFSSLGVFSRNFTRETGVTPSEFRRQVARQIG